MNVATAPVPYSGHPSKSNKNSTAIRTTYHHRLGEAPSKKTSPSVRNPAPSSSLSVPSPFSVLSSHTLQSPPPPHTPPPSSSSSDSSSSFLHSTSTFLFGWISPLVDAARGHPHDATHANTRFNARRPTKKDIASAGHYSAIPVSDPGSPSNEKESHQQQPHYSEKSNSSSSKRHKRVSFVASIDLASSVPAITRATTATTTASHSMFARQDPLDDDEPLLPLVSQPGMKNAAHPDDPNMSVESSASSSGSASSTSSTSTVIASSSSSTPLKGSNSFGLGLGCDNDIIAVSSNSPSATAFHERRPSIALSVCSCAHSDEDDVPTPEAIREAARDKRRLKLAIVLCTTFFCVELAGGILADSLALLSDSFHLLTDITSFCISLAAIYLSQRLPTAKHTFGYHRAEVLGALFSIFLIWGLTFLLVLEAYDRIRHPINIDGKTMSIVASLGVFVNICLMFVLGGHHHHHGDDDHHHHHGHEEEGTHAHDHGIHRRHTHSHGQNCSSHPDEHDMEHLSKYNPHRESEVMLGRDDNRDDEEEVDDALQVARTHKNLNITAATLHVLGDLLSSIGVLISSLVITFFPSMTILDPICTFVFSFLVILTTIGVFKRSVSILMEQVPGNLSVEETRETIRAVPGVLEVKRIHLWSLTVGQTALTARVYLQPDIQDSVQAAKVIRATRRVLRQQYGIRQSTIQIEVLRELTSSRSSSSSSKQLDRHNHHGEESFSSHHPHSHTHKHSHNTHSHHHHSYSSHDHNDGRAPERHDTDIIFSVGDDEDDDDTTRRAQ